MCFFQGSRQTAPLAFVQLEALPFRLCSSQNFYIWYRAVNPELMTNVTYSCATLRTNPASALNLNSIAAQLSLDRRWSSSLDKVLWEAASGFACGICRSTSFDSQSAINICFCYRAPVADTVLKHIIQYY